MIKEYITQIKSFYNILDFKKDILDWIPPNNNDYNNKNLIIGHPTDSHKGMSLGDILPYTILPFELKSKFNCKVFIPIHFRHVFENNPYVDGISTNYQQWGSLGTFGTTVQRTCNVWGIKTCHFKPKIYLTSVKPKQNIIAVSLNSKTGGQIKNKNYLENEILKLKKDFKIIQIGTKLDPIIRGIDGYYFNISYSNLIYFLSGCICYIGVQNSLYHLSKSIGLNIIGILPENVDPFFVKLPLLTQCNHLEIEMLPDYQKNRIYKWMNFVRDNNKNPDDSHHIGWLYPDTCHLTMNLNNEILPFCPKVSYDNILKCLNNEIYPYNDPRLYDYYSNQDWWI